LPALDWAAEHDPDREVREMAGFTVEILQRRAIDSESVAPVGFFRMIGGCGVPPAALAAKDAEPVIWPGDSIGSVGSLGCPWRGSVSDVSGIEDPLFQVEARPWEKYWERTEDPAVTDPPPMVTPPLPSVEDAEWAWLASAPPTHIYRMGSCWGGPDRWDGDVWLEIAPYRQALEHQEERIRLDSVIHLGRFRACGDDLAILLKADPSPVVREAAATSLAQVGDPAALLALQWAAEHDSDRDVRRTARFAAEILQGRLELMLKPEDQRLMPEIMPGSMFEPRMIGG